MRAPNRIGMTPRIACLAALFFVIQAAPLRAQTFVDGYWEGPFAHPTEAGTGFRAQVLSFAVDAQTGDVYAAGSPILSNPTAYVARWNGSGWDRFGGPQGEIRAMVHDGAGNLYVGGSFTRVQQPGGGLIDAHYVARWDGAEWHPLGGGLDGRVTAMALDPVDRSVYFGGDWNGGFDNALNANGSVVASPNIVKWTGTAWQGLGRGTEPGFGRGVSAIAVDPPTRDVIVAGAFVRRLFNADGSELEVEGIARWNGSVWSPMPGPTRGNINALASDADGALYAGGDFDLIGGVAAFGVARWDGQSWAALGRGTEGVGQISAIEVGGPFVYVGGSFLRVAQADGSGVNSPAIARWDTRSERWLAHDAGIGRNDNRPVVRALKYHQGFLHTGGNFESAGGLPASYVARWVDSPPPYDAAYTTFQVDARRTLGTIGMDASRMRLVVHNAERAGNYFLYDHDGDGIWTIRVPQPLARQVRYSFAFDLRFNSAGMDDWSVERGGLAGARELVLTNSAPRTLPVVTFDDLPVRMAPAGALVDLKQFFAPGSPAPYRFRVGSQDTWVLVDFFNLPERAVMGAHRYAANPGGAPPAGIVNRAAATFWDVELSPSSVSLDGLLSFDYQQVTGVAAPEALRLLHRANEGEPWQLRETELDLEAQTLSVRNPDAVNGQWTVGSVSPENPLTADVPGVASVPNPPEGARNVPEKPQLSWQPAEYASTYDLYVWRADAVEPATPVRAGLASAETILEQVLQSQADYRWRVVSRNVNGVQPGPVWSFTVGTAPDLYVQSMQVPAQAVGGQEMEISWTVENGGAGATRVPSWEERVYLSKDAVLDVKEDILLGHTTNASYLGAGDRYVTTMSVEVPLRIRSVAQEEIVSGPYYVIVQLDPRNRELEEDEQNNVTASATPVNISVPLLPDVRTTGPLTATPYCPSLTCTRGGCTVLYQDCSDRLPAGDLSALYLSRFQGDPYGIRYAFSWTNRNDGQAPLGATEDVIAFDRNEFFDAQSAIPGSFGATPAIAPGETAVVRTSPLPNQLVDLRMQATAAGQAMPDSGYFFIFADAQNRHHEGAGEDNNLYRHPIRTVFRSIPPSDVAVQSVSAPAAAASGDSVDISWTLRNNGPSAVVPYYWRDAVYLSAQGEFDPEDAIQIARFARTNATGEQLQADETRSYAERVKLPDGLEGTYYLFVRADDDGNLNEQILDRVYLDNNLGRSEPVAISLADYPNLRPVTLTLPNEVNAGTSAVISYRVRNDGSAPVDRDAWQDVLYLSRSETWTGEAAHTQRVGATASPQPGESYTRQVSFRFPPSLEGGQYYLHLMVDAEDAVYEHLGEEDNLFRSEPFAVRPAPGPDLVVRNVTAPVGATAGASITVGWDVVNQGDATTRATSWTDEVFLSTDDQLDAADLRLAELVYVGPLAPSESYSAEVQVTLPENFAGQRHIIVRSDRSGRVGDLVTSNNVAPGDAAVNVSLESPADLQLTGVTLLGTPTAGQPLRAQVTVTNVGAAIAADKRWNDVWKWSSSVDARDEEVLHAVTVTGPLAAGGSYAHDVELMLPAYASGEYYLTTSINDGHTAGESGRWSNNIDRRVVGVIMPPPVDLIVRNVQAPAQALPGETITISYEVVNVGSNTATGILYDAIHLSADQVLAPEDPRLTVQRRQISLGAGASESIRMSIRIPRLGVDLADAPPAEHSASDAASDVEADVPGVVPGSYHVIVWTDVRNNIRETDNDNNSTASATQTTISVPELTLGAPRTTDLAAERRSFFRVAMTDGRDLRVMLTNLAGDLRREEFEIYVAHERSPSPSDYDYAYLAERTVQVPHVLVPETRAGTYYVLVRNPHLMADDGTVQVSVLAEAFDFDILGVTPDAGGNSGRVVATITGAQLAQAGTFYLERGGDRIDGQIVRRNSSMEVEVRFDLRGERLGRYDVVARQDGGAEARLEQAFEVAIPVSNRLRYGVSAPPELLYNAPSSFELTVRNEDNVDHDVVLLTVAFPADHSFVLNSDDFTGLPFADGVFEVMPDAGMVYRLQTANPALAGGLETWGVVTAVARNVRVGARLQANVAVMKILSEVGTYVPMFVDVVGFSEAEFLAMQVQGLRALGSRLRQEGIQSIPAEMHQIYNQVLAVTEARDLDAQLRTQLASAGFFDEEPLGENTARLRYIASSVPGASFGALSGMSADMRNALLDAESCIYVGNILGITYDLGAIIYSIYVGFVLATNPVGWVFILTVALSAALLFWFASDTFEGEKSPYATVLCYFVTGSWDPNDILGPAGAGEARWVRRDASLDYKIRFENDAEVATAPARSVVVRQPLDRDLDLRAFRLGSFGFGPYVWEVPGNRAFYQERLDVRDSLGVFVDFDAGIDLTSGEAYFRFVSIDPATGEPSMNPRLGFLPPNVNPPEGDGFVAYRITPHPESKTGDRIDAEAGIVFDLNPPILTPAIFNTIDADPPSTMIASSAMTELDSVSVLLSWSGGDPLPGSGTRSFSLYAQQDGGSFAPVAQGLNDTTFVFHGVPGSRYGFFVLGEDEAGNVEPMKDAAEVRVLVSVEGAAADGVPKRFALHANYPNPFNASTTIPYEVAQDGDVEFAIYNVLGQRVSVIRKGHLTPGYYHDRLDFGHLASGVYFYEVRIRGEGGMLFRDVRKFVLVK